ncbi:MAG: hypothetical protein QOC77_1722 [Thermoleophilaceae bacterium]|jgi:hypothetical protein|nr:hypothetical protein [Thermoleophilaceae bacterium]
MSPGRKAAVGVAALRIAYGVALVVAPARTTRSWLGSDAARAGTGVALRALGAREVAIHAGAVAAALGGGAVRPWLVASIGGDCSDVVATFGAGSGLPAGAALKTLAVAGGSAALSAAVIAAVDA